MITIKDADATQTAIIESAPALSQTNDQLGVLGHICKYLTNVCEKKNVRQIYFTNIWQTIKQRFVHFIIKDICVCMCEHIHYALNSLIVLH